MDFVDLRRKLGEVLGRKMVVRLLIFGYIWRGCGLYGGVMLFLLLDLEVFLVGGGGVGLVREGLGYFLKMRVFEREVDDDEGVWMGL